MVAQHAVERVRVVEELGGEDVGGDGGGDRLRSLWDLLIVESRVEQDRCREHRSGSCRSAEGLGPEVDSDPDH
ncbi:hypothetical protein GQ85_07855 [Rhodococcus rhodochrous]|nr:hypothetical protein GQ85_07855 [Rhodococcus rhodochrous]